MPLLDDTGYGFAEPHRVLPVRQQDQLSREERAASPLGLLDDIKEKVKTKTTEGPSPFQSLLDSLADSATGKLDTKSLLSGLLQPTTPSPVDPKSELVGLAERSPIIGTKNYQVGRGDPGLRATAQQIAAQQGWTGGQWAAWDAVINAESGWRPTAQNPTSTAFGLGQFLDSTWKSYGAKTADPTTQLLYMARYIKDRYGTPQKALEFHKARGWY